MSLSYEEQRIQNIKDNEALLLSLGLGAPTIPKAPKKIIPKKKTDNDTFKPEKPKPIRTPKSTLINENIENENGTPDSSNGLRRSSRSRQSSRGTPNYKGDTPLYREDVIFTPTNRKRERNGDAEEDDGDSDDENDWRQRKAQKLGIRTQDPKSFGHIPGVEVGTCWPTRMECSTDAIHAPTVAGISGNAETGAWSVALSGGYPDDVDLGYAFTYTGSGGRDLKGTKQNPKNLRTAEQSYDQSFDNRFNAALKKSSETRKPVRVIRGFKLPSVYAPAEGYRYDGLYTVEKAWMARGLTKGLMVCRYAFKRMEGQPELPVRVGDDEAEGEKEVAEDQDEEDKVDREEENEEGEKEEDKEMKEDKEAEKEENVDQQETEDTEIVNEDGNKVIKENVNLENVKDLVKDTIDKAASMIKKAVEIGVSIIEGDDGKEKGNKENKENKDISEEKVGKRTSLRRTKA